MQDKLELENVLYSVMGPMALITINRPEKHNAISLATLDDLHAAVDAAAANDDVRVITITGAQAGGPGKNQPRWRLRSSRPRLGA